MYAWQYNAAPAGTRGARLAQRHSRAPRRAAGLPGHVPAGVVHPDQGRAIMSSNLRIWLNIVGMLIGLLSISAGLVWLERRLLAVWQDRYGPNRVGPFGLLQVLADMIKLLTKEDWVPSFADRPLFVLAPR